MWHALHSVGVFWYPLRSDMLHNPHFRVRLSAGSSMIVIKRSIALSRWVTRKACGALIDNILRRPGADHLFLIGMACSTRKYGVVVCVGMTFGTLIPYTLWVPL